MLAFVTRDGGLFGLVLMPFCCVFVVGLLGFDDGFLLTLLLDVGFLFGGGNLLGFFGGGRVRERDAADIHSGVSARILRW